MENDNDDEEEINEAKVKNQDVLTKEEVLNTIDMTAYKERIENIIGRSYSYLFFDFFDNIYHSKIKNKISSPLNKFLNKWNQKEDTFWMNIYKSIKFYSKENLPILITKYFISKAENEFKFIYNESRKYTNNPYQFIDIYIKKMKRYDFKKLNESMNLKQNNIFDTNLKRSLFFKNFVSKKTILRPKKSPKMNKVSMNEDNSDSSTKEEEIKHKKHLRTEIMKQIHRLKIKSIKEVEKANNIQNKQKKKYGGIKSRFLDVFTKQKILLRMVNFKSSHKINNNTHNNLNFNKNKDEDEQLFSSSKRNKSINNSKLSFYNSNYSKKNSKYLTEDKNSNNNYYLKTHSYYNRKNTKNVKNILRSNKTNFEGLPKNNYFSKNKKKISLFTLDFKHSAKKGKTNFNLFTISNKKTNALNRLSGNSNNINNRPKSSLNHKKADTKLFINKLEKKRNKEFLNDFLYRNNNKDDYSNKLYELFKRTECF